MAAPVVSTASWRLCRCTTANADAEAEADCQSCHGHNMAEKKAVLNVTDIGLLLNSLGVRLPVLKP